MPKYVDIHGNTKVGRKYASGRQLSASDLEDKDKLAESLNKLAQRVAELESRIPPDSLEIELDVTSGTAFKVYHGFGGPVRYMVVCRQWDVLSSNISLAVIPGTTNADWLGLSPSGTGRIVLRIEPSQYGFTPR